jgi:hypothetical protein
MNEATPAAPDCLLEIDDNLYSLTALIEAQAALKATDIDESSTIRDAIEEASASLQATMERSLAAADNDHFLLFVLDNAIGNLRTPMFEKAARKLSEQCATSLQQQEELINELVDASIKEAIASKIANVRPTLDGLSKGLKARASLQRLVSGEASLPRDKAFYQRAVKERIASYTNAINSLVPADFPND